MSIAVANPSEKALYADALAQYDAFGKGKEVIVVGRSLGTGIATYVASQKRSEGIGVDYAI